MPSNIKPATALTQNLSRSGIYCVVNLTSPIVAPVNLTKKNALVPVARSEGPIAFANTWYGAWNNIPIPIPAISGKVDCERREECSSSKARSPEADMDVRENSRE